MSDLALPSNATRAAPADLTRNRPSGWYGVWAVAATEGALFAYLLFSFAYARAEASGWAAPDGASLQRSGVAAAALTLSALPVFFARRALALGVPARGAAALLLALGFGCSFAALQGYDLWLDVGALTKSAAGSYEVLLDGASLAHAGVGLFALAGVAAACVVRRERAAREAAVSIVAIYWVFVVAAGLIVFAALHLAS